MSASRITEKLEEAGFTEIQIDALLEAFTLHHHTHSIDEIIGLEEELEDDECEPEDTDDGE